MARDEHKRQKSMAKKKMRENRIRKQANITRNPTSVDIVESMLRGSWYKCIEISIDGISNLLCIRKTSIGFSACSFLVDSYCLGVKDVSIIRELNVAVVMERLRDSGGNVVTPEYALKKIQSAIEGARQIGFEPHPKTAVALKVFEGVDANGCTVDFEFGRDGKPLFIAGPFDDPARIIQVLRKLQELGEGNYHYVVQANHHFHRITATDSVDNGDEDYGNEEDGMVLEAEKVTQKSS